MIRQWRREGIACCNDFPLPGEKWKGVLKLQGCNENDFPRSAAKWSPDTLGREARRHSMQLDRGEPVRWAGQAVIYLREEPRGKNGTKLNGRVASASLQVSFTCCLFPYCCEGHHLPQPSAGQSEPGGCGA